MGSIGVVLDTNIYVSALGFGGPPLKTLFRTFEDDVRLLVTDATLAELERVLEYDRLPFTTADRIQYPAILRREAERVEPETSIDAIDRDPDDNAFLECAVAGNASYIVSGDVHLLDLGSYEDVEIVTAAEFLKLP